MADLSVCVPSAHLYCPSCCLNIFSFVWGDQELAQSQLDLCRVKLATSTFQ